MDCGCAPMLRFLALASDGATRAPNLEPRVLVNFVPVWGRIASPIMHRFGRCFRYLYTVARSDCRWRHKMRKIAVEILQSINNRTQSLRKILGLRMVITDLVINTVLGTVTRHPAGMHCPSWDDAFVSSFLRSQYLCNQGVNLSFSMINRCRRYKWIERCWNELLRSNRTRRVRVVSHWAAPVCAKLRTRVAN